jgi:hypothetical protein
MGVKCIRAEEPVQQGDPVFLYQNMIKINKKHNLK